ncbi:hypothetical protein [Pantoea sp.]|uniref:hypothetical protein n=1 Tax=Pantoea sp. TaxID=69393 RepID=UPI0028ADC4BF|nr:hypothetical protein [Pantoea sp.]
MLAFSRANIIQADNARAELFNLAQLFVFIFAIIFTATSQQPLNVGSTGGAEQWVNVLSDFFTGPQDFLFSYGPLYWLSGKVVAQHSLLTHWLTAIFISLYAAISWAIMLRLAIRYRAVILLAIVYVSVVRVFDSAAIYFILPLFIIVYCRSIGQERWLENKRVLFSLGVFIAFLFYVRFFYGMVALLTFGSYFFSTGVIKRQFTAMALFTISATLFYFLFGFLIFHHVSSVIDYTVINSQLNFGNSVDMTYDVRLKNATYIIIFLVFVCFNFFLAKNQPVLLLTINGLLLIFFKIGFSRADHYINYFIFPISLMSLIFVVSSKRRWFVLAFFMLALMLTMGHMSIFPSVRKLADLMTHEDFSLSYTERAAGKYPQYVLPADIVAQIGGQTIDVYPNSNEYLLANKLNYHHRPSFQNYMTLTPVLDNLNASFFAGDDAPEYILWTATMACLDSHCPAYDDFDYKYVLNEDPLTSTAILSHYQVIRTFPGERGTPVMLLKKKPQSAPLTPQVLGKVSLHFGEWIPVPKFTSGAVKLKPELNLTLLAKVQNALYRGGILYVNYKLTNGEIKRYRLNIINAQSGVWVSPWLNSFPQQGERVIEVMLETPNRHYFKDDFQASWENYPFDNIKAENSLLQAFTAQKPVGLSEVTTTCDASIDAVESSRFILDGEAKTRLMSSGWTAFSIEHNQPAERAWLTLTNEQGQRFYTPMTPAPRGDVANYFHKPGLINSGYNVVADVTDFKGNYQVGVSIAGDGKLLQCSNFAKPITLQ